MSNPAISALTGGRARLASKASAFTFAATACLALSACNTPSPHAGMGRTSSLQAFQANDRHPIQVAKGDVRLEIDVPRFSSGLSPRQYAEIDAFVADYKELGESEIKIMVPAGGRNEGAAMTVLGKLRSRIRGQGIDDKAIRYTPYYVKGGAGTAPVVVTYKRYYANPSPCGNWPDNLAEEPLNKAYEEFGCATQNNLAAVVANPRDLIVPRTMTPADQMRRSVTLDKWRRGETTSSVRTEEESGSSSEVKE